jgi:DNA-directed RNA polymerase II subunit RPB2
VCPFGCRYFVINGSEKVLIAQERINNNQIYIFRSPKGFFEAQIRSVTEKSTRPGLALYVSSLFGLPLLSLSSELTRFRHCLCNVRLCSASSASFLRCYKYPPRDTSVASGPIIRCQIPYVKKEVALAIVFRALGFTSDRQILEHICYDFNDKQMIDALRPSLEEAFTIQDKRTALDYIGKRGATPGAVADKRIAYAETLLRKEFLAHIGTGEHCETKKAYFLGCVFYSTLLQHVAFSHFPWHHLYFLVTYLSSSLPMSCTGTCATSCCSRISAAARKTTAITLPTSAWTWRAHCSASCSGSCFTASPS